MSDYSTKLNHTNLEVSQNGPNIFLKAHVNHSVSLIQAEVAADPQIETLLVQHIHQSAGSSYHNVDTSTVARRSKEKPFQKGQISGKFIQTSRNKYCESNAALICK